MAEGRNSGPAAGRDPKTGRFGPGNGGRPPGTRHRITRAAEKLLERDAKGLTQKAIELAMAGDTTALRLCLERIAPALRPGDRHIAIPLPAAPGEALDAILGAVAGGDLLPAEGEKLAGLVKTKADLASLAEIESRLAALETQLEGKSR